MFGGEPLPLHQPAPRASYLSRGIYPPAASPRIAPTTALFPFHIFRYAPMSHFTSYNIYSRGWGGYKILSK